MFTLAHYPAQCRECETPIAVGDEQLRAEYQVPRAVRGMDIITVRLCAECGQFYLDSQEPTGSRS